MDSVGGFILITDGADAFLKPESARLLKLLTAMTALSPSIAQKGLQLCIDKFSEKTADDITAALIVRSDESELPGMADILYKEGVIDEDYQFSTM